MPNTSLRADLAWSPALVRDTLREHRVGILAWAVGGAAAMVFMGLALNEEMASFPGGPQALAASVTPAAEAMRVLRWPADHLETLGGYLTFHNVMLVSGFLCLYAGMQGARVVRGPEERHSLETVLSTGWSRTAYLLDRSFGFLLALIAISAGVAAGIAITLAMVDQPDARGSLITMLSVCLGSLLAFSLGALVSQLTASGRSAAGITSIILVAMYLANNAVDDGDTLGWIRYVTPFHWVNQSRALVPGEDLNPAAMLVLAGASIVLLGAAAWAFTRRDYGAALLRRRARATAAHAVSSFRLRWWLHAPWIAGIRQHALGLIAWAAASAAFAGLMIALQPAAMTVFEQFSYYLGMVGGTGTSAEAMYMTFATDVIAPIVAAYAITRSASWVADLGQGRVEMLLSSPMSWTRLVLERLLATGLGVAVILTATLGTLWLGSLTIEAEVSLPAIARVCAMSLILALAVGALAAVAVAALRSTVAVTLLAVYVGFAYLLTWLIPMFGWPTWTEQLSIFMAFAHPYREWPAGGSVLLLAIGIVGTIAACVLAERSPKVSG